MLFEQSLGSKYKNEPKKDLTEMALKKRMLILRVIFEKNYKEK